MSAEVEVRTGLSKPDVGRSQRSVLLRPDDGSVWPNKSVPKSKIDGPVMILTPHVGNVRVVFEGGEAIAGRLHAVGKNKIVVDTSLGRITLDALRADRVDRLGKSTRGLSTPTSASSDTRGLDRVRVAAAGGTFYGHLVSQKGSQVTLILDGGYRITLESNDVQPAGRQRTSSRIQRSEPGRGE